MCNICDIPDIMQYPEFTFIHLVDVRTHTHTNGEATYL